MMAVEVYEQEDGVQSDEGLQEDPADEDDSASDYADLTPEDANSDDEPHGPNHVEQPPEEHDNSSDEEDDPILALQDHPLPENANELLYDGAPLTILQHYLVVQHFSQRFNISRECKSALLSLIRQHCPQEKV